MQSYKLLSARIKFLMVSVPWFTSVLPLGKGIPTLLQLITGRGNPSAWQTAWKVLRCNGVAGDGGTFVKTGRPDRRWIRQIICKQDAVGAYIWAWSYYACYFEHALLQLNNCHHILPEKINPLLYFICWTTQLIQYTPIHNNNPVTSWQCLKICTSSMPTCLEPNCNIGHEWLQPGE